MAALQVERKPGLVIKPGHVRLAEADVDLLEAGQTSPAETPRREGEGRAQRLAGRAGGLLPLARRQECHTGASYNQLSACNGPLCSGSCVEKLLLGLPAKHHAYPPSMGCPRFAPRCAGPLPGAVAVWKCQTALAVTQASFVVGSVILKSSLKYVDEEKGEAFSPIVYALFREACAGPILLLLSRAMAGGLGAACTSGARLLLLCG